ncbi:MAG TPA: crossover junction endodeoxyribonuclease RuvC [bacterium]|nr:crossover junction endodeoxyribonuclease RuvC [bacterium]
MQKNNSYIILGIDPGYAITGWAILESQGQKLQLIDCGAITSDKNEIHANRLKNINQELDKIIKQYQPKILAVEELFFFKNLKTALKVAEARGVILMTAIQHDLVIREFTPLQVKQAVVGYGRADKNQIQQMIKVILKMTEKIKLDDTADAVAIAITCAHGGIATGK